jgi:hypothetical protein
MWLSPLSNIIQRGINNPQLMDAALALHDNRLSDAEPLLRAHLKTDPFDVAAIRMMAEGCRKSAAPRARTRARFRCRPRQSRDLPVSAEQTGRRDCRA